MKKLKKKQVPSGFICLYYVIKIICRGWFANLSEFKQSCRYTNNEKLNKRFKINGKKQKIVIKM